MKISIDICPIAFAHVAEYMANQQSESISETIGNLAESAVLGQGCGETGQMYTTAFYPQASVMYVFEHNSDGTINRVDVNDNVPWGCFIDENLDIIDGTERMTARERKENAGEK